MPDSFLSKAYTLFCRATATGLGVGSLPDVLLKNGALSKYFPARWTGAGFLGSCEGLLFLVSHENLQSRWDFLGLGLFTIFSCLVSDRAEKFYKVKDETRIVIDEIAGLLWAFLFVPLDVIPAHARWAVYIVGFALFRLFDVLKWPFKEVQNIRGGVGIVFDDVFAGLLANLILQIGVRFALKL